MCDAMAVALLSLGLYLGEFLPQIIQERRGLFHFIGEQPEGGGVE